MLPDERTLVVILENIIDTFIDMTDEFPDCMIVSDEAYSQLITRYPKYVLTDGVGIYFYGMLLVVSPEIIGSNFFVESSDRLGHNA